MNFALSTIIIIILLLPGAVFQRAYYGHLKLKKASIHVPFSEVLFKGILYSIFIHVCAICTLSIKGETPNFVLVYDIIQGKELSLSNHQFTHFFKQFGFYNIAVILITWTLVKAAKQFIEHFNLHINYFSLRNSNYWFEVFSAKYLDRKNVRGTLKTTDLIFVDILTDKNIIYSGFLKDFNYSPHKDELENVVMTSTRKREFVSDEDAVDKPIPKTSHIPGDVFLIPMSKIININIHYIRLTKGKH